MTQYAMPGTHEFSGSWFLPTDSTRRVGGTLSWSRRATVRLHDALEPQLFNNPPTAYPVVYGVSKDCQDLTLWDVQTTGPCLVLGPAGHGSNEQLMPGLVMVGAHVEPTTCFSEMTARIPGLEIWLSRSSYGWTKPTKTEHAQAEFTLELANLPVESFPVPAINSRIEISIVRQVKEEELRAITIEFGARLRIVPDVPKTHEWFIEQIAKATALISFVAGAPMSPDHIEAKVAGPSPAYVVDVLVSLRDAAYCPFKRSSDFFMLRRDMECDLGQVFANWYERYPAVDMPCRLAQSILCSKDLWMHVEFLSLMQALEGFHRAVLTGQYMEDAAYEVVKQTLLNAIPPHVGSDHRSSLKSRIHYGNQISLRKRLDALAGRLDCELRRTILGGKGKVPTSWVDTRNYYTHWDQASGENVLGPMPMHQAMARMRAFVRALYLDYVGISQVAIQRSFGNFCDESQYLAHLNSVG